MLEGAVARFLNQILGKYVVDLDTENLNVGIFSGHMQLTDLKLKSEALYELNLPIEVKVGTVGKIWLQIPWTSLWNQPIIINIEDLHIVCGPIVGNEPFDPDKYKRLIRAFKRKAFTDLDIESYIIGGPGSFSEHLIANILNNLQITVTNIHVRYEDAVSTTTPLAAGLCIGTITAETTNNKWRPAQPDKNSKTFHYLVKIEALSAYWNANTKLTKWDLPSQYYVWRNTMASSLQNFAMNNENFEFILKPMTTKIKTTVLKSDADVVSKISSDFIIQDCNLQLSKNQYESILAVNNSLKRMFISWNFLSMRPIQKILENGKKWWKYAYSAVLEQHVRPYSWSKMRTVRSNFKEYVEAYKEIILNPNDTELKLDLQKREDNLSVISIIVARQQARLLVQTSSLGEKNLWSMLPSPERILLCEKIGFFDHNQDKLIIHHNYTFRAGNITLSFTNNSKEILIATLTQTNLNLQPNYGNDTYKAQFKVEGLIIEGSSTEENLIPFIQSEHLSTSPAYFMKIELMKMPKYSKSSYKVNFQLDSVECLYNEKAIKDLEVFFSNSYYSISLLTDYLIKCPQYLYKYFDKKLTNKWDLNLNIKIPYVVIPESGSLLKTENILIIDFGRFLVTTEICEEINDEATEMEMEEQLYLKLNIENKDMQLLFCDTSDNWKDARKEKDSDLHLISKTSFTAVYAHCSEILDTIPNYKFNISFQSLKLNISERTVGLLLKFFNNRILNEKFIRVPLKEQINFHTDLIQGKFSRKYLLRIQNNVTIGDNLMKTKRIRNEKCENKSPNAKRKNNGNAKKENMNEAWARYVDLPGLEDNISPSNNIITLLRFTVNEFLLVFSKSSDSTDRQYLMFRLGIFVMDVAIMTYGPAYQISLNSLLLTDKLHTTPSGQYLDLIHSPFPSTIDVVNVLYRKVSASCPDFWSHFHGVETSLVADFGTIYLLLHQEAIHTIIKYSKYMYSKIKDIISSALGEFMINMVNIIRSFSNKISTPVPQGSVKFSHSARLADLNIRICDSDFDIVNIQLSGLEIDFLFRANERLVFRSYLSNINVEHLSDITLYSKVLSTDEDKVFEIKYVRNAPHIKQSDISRDSDEIATDGSFKFCLGQIHLTFLYKLVVQLQRYITNLEAIPYINYIIEKIYKIITTATETLKTSTKINLAINVCGPVFLIPQKSSSPNVVVIDTGELQVENFFKEYASDSMENILIKWNGTTVTRGVMTLASTLEMQEVLIEPLQINVDVKRYTNMKTSQKTWDIDGILNTIQLTLGQRDISTIFSTYTDNIGEGKIIDLFQNQIKSPVESSDTDETVKNLEAFFCEPKQKNIVAKFSLESIVVLLFFDSGELLSSPIRDLNHGLCKFEMTEINSSFVIYTDNSLDGKLAIDTILLEEIGPYANIFDKGILHSPVDDNKNNNCNITVNRPPIVDVTFHQNKTGDKSIDIIIGRLCLTLSVPFCERLILFIFECIPKDNFIDAGIVNHGYENDINQMQTKNMEYFASITVSLRINKPEFKFLVETTSNRKRYFLTKTEILSDYSQHGSQLNFIITLSSLHSLFYDLGMSSSEPYVILKQCDIEFSKCYSEEKGNKITTSISAIYIQFCSRVMHSITDILNEITEHCKIPDIEPTEKERRKNDKITEAENLWEPKKIVDVFHLSSSENLILDKMENKLNVKHEVLIVPNFDIVLIFELDNTQMFLVKSTLEITIYDWSSLLNCTCECTIQANYFNESLQCWEPVIDPVVLDEKEYRPWNVLIKIFQDRSMPMMKTNEGKPKKEHAKIRKTGNSYTTTEDEDSGEDMMYLEPINSLHNRSNRRVKNSLSTFLDDSDSENEDDAMEKLAAAISDLFTGDWNESEDSDCVHSSEGEDDSDSNDKPKSQENEDINCKKSTYILIDAKEILNITVTPTLIKVLNELSTMYSNKTLSIISNKKSINLINDIGPKSKIELYEKKNVGGVEEDVLLYLKTFENQDSAPNSPVKSFYYVSEFIEDLNDDRDSCTDDTNKTDFDVAYDFKTLSTLQFPVESTADLFETINKHFIRIYIPNFQPIQTTCSKWNWEKLLRLHSTALNQTYYLAAKHTIGKIGRQITISSPLQIRNKTCFALSVLYHPSILQQLNLEPVGDMTNPFETTMRIAILEAYENYNIPLYIAYHCKLFIQPAYAEGHYVSDSGIWWKDLATDLGIAHNLHCKPKSDSNLEIFALRVMMEKNLKIINSQVHSIPNYTIHLLPPLILNNFLPYLLEVKNISQKQLIKLEPGERNSVYSLDLTKDQKLLVIVKYNNQTWAGTLNLTTHLDEKIVILTTDTKENIKQLAINIKAEREGSCNIFFYTPYWIINKTGLPLQIKASATNTIYESANEEILLFTYKRHGKQTLQIRVYESNWSNEFGLECAGTTGLVICKDNERKKKYQFFLSNQLSEMCPRLIKIVTLLPGFLLTNNTSKHLRFMEINDKIDLWIDLVPNQTVIFWPETTSMQMSVKYRDSSAASKPFPVALQHRTVLRMDKGGGITVEVSGGVFDSFLISFNEYKPGDAPVLVKNYCSDVYLRIYQQDDSNMVLLNPYTSLLYTWEMPTKSRQLVWNVYNDKRNGYFINIFQDGYGEERIRSYSVTPNTSTAKCSSSDDSSDSSDSVKTTLNKKVHKDKRTVYWLCYREDKQRVVLFTEEIRIFNHIMQNVFQDSCDFDSLISLSGIGISIFTPDNLKKEHVYVSLVDAPAIWEVNVGHKWKTLTLELASWIEDKYRLHYKKCQLKDYIHIDFEKMYMMKPFFAELRRTYNPAVYLHYRKSKNYQYLNCKLYTFQIDNKLSNSIVLHPLPLNNIKGLNYFIDISILKASTKVIDVYKHIKFSIGNFYLNIENNLFINLTNLFKQKKKLTDELISLYINDMKTIATKPKQQNIKTIVEYLSISTFEIQLNISNKMQISLNNYSPFCYLLDYLFPINISPYMPLEGVKIRIASMELIDLNEHFATLIYNFFKETASQFLQQYYSHVLGLQVLVNSFAHRPSIDENCNEPEKMVDILLYGSRCLLGHINMSPAALEQCIVDIFANQTIENIQRIRRHGSYQKCEVIPKTLTASCRNFNTGVPNALNQLIVKSQNAGLNCDGEMFFRTTGKALLSLITRHPDNKSDSVQVAKEALRRASILGEPIRIQQRMTRYYNKFKGLQPFSMYESMGQNLLATVANCRFINDTYWSHASIDKVGKTIILVSLEHIIRINKFRLWGSWEVEWVFDLDDIISMPKISSTELIFNMKKGENNTEELVKLNGDKEMLTWLHEKIEQAIIVSMEEKSWIITGN